MKIGHRQFLIFSFLVFSAICTLYYGLFRLQLGNYVTAEWWLVDLYAYKDHLARQKKTPRLIIAAGSNCLFGINSQIVEEKTGYNVINLSSHLALDFDFYYYKIMEYIQDGDTIILPLEYEYYSYNSISDWFANNMIAWGKEDYIDNLPLTDLVKFIFHVPKMRIYKGFFNQGEEIPTHDRSFIIKVLSSSSASEWKGYGYETINQHGEMSINSKPIPALALSSTNIGYPYIRNAELSDHFLEVYRKIEELVKSRNGRLVLTWPASIRNRRFDHKKPGFNQEAQKLREKLANESIPIFCPPEDFNLDLQYFFNTHYHLNNKGSAIRSEKLAECINRELPLK